MKKGKIVVGMSGGVDSSAAAFLLKEAGYDVIGVTMRTWREQPGDRFDAAEDAKKIAEILGIPHYTVDYSDIFRREVVDRFVLDYQKARTPNPCVICNRCVKWKSLLETADLLGAEFVATGHYAHVIRLPNGRCTLSEARREGGKSKDQTYALYRLTQEQLKRTVMPLGGYLKEEVRRIAADAGLPAASAPDSEENCFIPDDNYAGFIGRYTGNEDVPGNFVDLNGKILGRHRGIIHYTIGQRKHLGLAMGHPIFVKEIRPETNEVVIAENEDLFSFSLTAEDLNMMGEETIEDGEIVSAKIRYNHRGAEARLYREGDDRIRAEFTEPQRAITPGQAAVFYRDGYLIGGGTIL